MSKNQILSDKSEADHDHDQLQLVKQFRDNFPVHLRRMWSAGEIVLLLDEFIKRKENQ